MNELSWMIYFAGVVGALGTVMALIAAALIIGTPVAAFFLSFDEHVEPHISRMKVNWRLFSLGIALAIMACLIPSKETVYAIAASETGESVLHSETGGKAVQALNAWLDLQIADDADRES